VARTRILRDPCGRYPTDEDWVFASPHSGGRLPYWPGSLYKAHLEPAAKEVGIVGASSVMQKLETALNDTYVTPRQSISTTKAVM